MMSLQVLQASAKDMTEGVLKWDTKHDHGTVQEQGRKDLVLENGKSLTSQKGKNCSHRP
jgi:hypothetical protein